MTESRSQTRDHETRTTTDLQPRSALPRWVYTETVRRIFDPDPDRHLRLVGRPIGGAMRFQPDLTPDFVVRPADLWLFQTTSMGLAQVECVREVSRTLVPRMMFYREVITRAYPHQPLEQFVIVTGDGTIRHRDDPVYSGDYFALHVLYIQDVDPATFEAGPGFATLRRYSQAPHFAQLLLAANMALGRFMVTLQDDAHDEAVLRDDSGTAHARIPEHLLSLYFQGRFGDHPEVPREQQDDDWATDIAVALAVHAITDFERTRSAS
jgi:hypothetical protein